MVAGVIQARAGVADPVKEIKQLEVRMADTPFVRGQVEDEDRRYPTSRETADHSFFYLAAVALMDGEMTQAQFEGERWMQPTMKSLMERMTIRTDASLNKYTPGSFPCVLQLTTVNGESRTVEVFYPKGHPKNRMSSAELRVNSEAARARYCPRRSKPKLSRWFMIWKRWRSVDELMSHLALERIT